jgi:5-hydroxyisourate hydrolase-like protein (transthyretin family)
VVQIESFKANTRVISRNRLDKIEGGPKPSFRFPDLLPGKYTFLIRANGYAQTRSKEVMVMPGETTTGLVVDLLKGGTLKGTLKDPKGEPLAGVSVKLMDKTYNPSLPLEEIFVMAPEQNKKTSSNSKGTFRLSHVRAGQYVLKIESEGMARKVVKEIAVQEGETTDLGNIQLSRGGRIRGMAYDEHGRPAAGVKVTAASMEAGSRKTVTTDDKGRFEIKNLGQGEYTVSMIPKDFWAALKYKSVVTVFVYDDQTSQADIYSVLAERNKK